MGYGSLFLQHGSQPFGHSFGIHQPFNHPNGHHHHPVTGGPHNAFVGDIRGDKFYGNFNGYQKISSSATKPASLFRGVNYFPQEDHRAAYKETVDATERQTEWENQSIIILYSAVVRKCFFLRSPIKIIRYRSFIRRTAWSYGCNTITVDFTSLQCMLRF